MELKDTPWTDVVIETDDIIIFRDGYPVSPGHLLFVPKVNDIKHITQCFRSAQVYGSEAMRKDGATGYNIGMNCGESAGQTIMYPHVHMIPRYDGDCENPRGGVRHVIPGKGNY